MYGVPTRAINWRNASWDISRVSGCGIAIASAITSLLKASPYLEYLLRSSKEKNYVEKRVRSYVVIALASK